MPRETDFHRWLKARSRAGKGVRVGIGDDAAWIDPGLILKDDAVVEGVHFDRATPAQIGHKAMARPLSDLAAVAAVPRFALVSFILSKRTGYAKAKAIYRAAERTAKKFGVRIVGGDVVVARAPLSVTVTIVGKIGPHGFVSRSGARPGDRIFVTGPLGGSILGKHLRFRPRISEALAIARRVRPTAMIDISDGLAIDLNRLCEASGVGAEIFPEKIPISAAAKRLSKRSGRSALRHAIEDGEDYELLYTARRSGGIGVITRGRKVSLPVAGWNPSI
jgi:thiamine-monophosphate kinase